MSARMAKTVTQVSPSDIVCTACHAQPGMRCAVRRRSASRDFHKARLRDAALRNRAAA